MQANTMHSTGGVSVLHVQLQSCDEMKGMFALKAFFLASDHKGLLEAVQLEQKLVKLQEEVGSKL